MHLNKTIGTYSEVNEKFSGPSHRGIALLILAHIFRHTQNAAGVDEPRSSGLVALAARERARASIGVSGRWT